MIVADMVRLGHNSDAAAIGSCCADVSGGSRKLSAGTLEQLCFPFLQAAASIFPPAAHPNAEKREGSGAHPACPAYPDAHPSAGKHGAGASLRAKISAQAVECLPSLEPNQRNGYRFVARRRY